MKLTNKTEEEYKAVTASLQKLGLKVPSQVAIMANIVGICEAIAAGEDNETIIKLFSINIKPTSFSTLFKKTTGVSMLDVPKMSQFDRRRVALRQMSLNEEQIDKILEVV
jgi:mannose/fructose/N-acetylgalactosamine-specific phosphotransferase system component IIB